MRYNIFLEVVKEFFISKNSKNRILNKKRQFCRKQKIQTDCLIWAGLLTGGFQTTGTERISLVFSRRWTEEIWILLYHFWLWLSFFFSWFFFCSFNGGREINILVSTKENIYRKICHCETISSVEERKSGKSREKWMWLNSFLPLFPWRRVRVMKVCPSRRGACPWWVEVELHWPDRC